MVSPWIVCPSIRNYQFLRRGKTEKLVPDTDRCFADSEGGLSAHHTDDRDDA